MAPLCGIRFPSTSSTGSFRWGISIVGEKNEYSFIRISVRLDKTGKYIYVPVGQENYKSLHEFNEHFE